MDRNELDFEVEMLKVRGHYQTKYGQKGESIWHRQLSTVFCLLIKKLFLARDAFVRTNRRALATMFLCLQKTRRDISRTVEDRGYVTIECYCIWSYMPRRMAQQRMTLSDRECLKSTSSASRAVSLVTELLVGLVGLELKAGEENRPVCNKIRQCGSTLIWY